GLGGLTLGHVTLRLRQLKAQSGCTQELSHNKYLFGALTAVLQRAADQNLWTHWSPFSIRLTRAVLSSSGACDAGKMGCGAVFACSSPLSNGEICGHQPSIPNR